MRETIDSEVTVDSLDALERLLGATNHITFPSLKRKHIREILKLLKAEHTRSGKEPISLTMSNLKLNFPSDSSQSTISTYISRAIKELTSDELVVKSPIKSLYKEDKGRKAILYKLIAPAELNTIEEFELEQPKHKLITKALATGKQMVNKVKSLVGVPASFELTTLSLAAGARISNRDKRLETVSRAAFLGEEVKITSYTTGKTDHDGKPIGRSMTSDLIILSLLQARDMEYMQKELDNKNFDVPNLFRVDTKELAKELRSGESTERELNNAYRTVSQAIQRIAHMSHEIEFPHNSEFAKNLSEYSGNKADTLHIRHIILQTSGGDEFTKIQRYFTYSYPEHIFEDMKRCRGLIAFPKKLLHRKSSSYDAILYYWLRSICSSGQSFEASLEEVYINITRNKDVTWKHFSEYILEEMSFHSGKNINDLDIGITLEFDFYGYDISVKRVKKNNKSLYFKFTGSRIAKEVNYTDENFTPLVIPE